MNAKGRNPPYPPPEGDKKKSRARRPCYSARRREIVVWILMGLGLVPVLNAFVVWRAYQIGYTQGYRDAWYEEIGI
jgi:hypothetical protein